MIRILVISFILILGQSSKAEAQSFLDPFGLYSYMSKSITTTAVEIANARYNIALAKDFIVKYEKAKTKAEREYMLCQVILKIDLAVKNKVLGYSYFQAVKPKINLLRKYNTYSWKVSHLNTLNELKDFVDTLGYYFLV